MLTILQWTNTTSVISKWGTFSKFSYLVILLLLLPINFTVSRVESWRWYPVSILNVILISSLSTYILTWGLNVLWFLIIYSWISDTEYDPSGNSNSSFHVEADILNTLFLYDFFIFPHIVNAKIW